VPTQPVGSETIREQRVRWALLFLVPDRPSTPTATITMPAKRQRREQFGLDGDIEAIHGESS
jgi:hypothetical protein